MKSNPFWPSCWIARPDPGAEAAFESTLSRPSSPGRPLNPTRPANPSGTGPGVHQSCQPCSSVHEHLLFFQRKPPLSGRTRGALGPSAESTTLVPMAPSLSPPLTRIGARTEAGGEKKAFRSDVPGRRARASDSLGRERGRITLELSACASLRSVSPCDLSRFPES